MPALTSELIVRRLFERRRRGDVEGVLALLHEDIVATTVADGSVLRGIDRVCAYFAREHSGDRRTEVDAHQVETEGDVVTVRGRIRVFTAGCLTDSPACWRFVVRDGRVWRIDPVTAGTLRLVA